MLGGVRCSTMRPRVDLPARRAGGGPTGPGATGGAGPAPRQPVVAADVLDDEQVVGPAGDRAIDRFADQEIVSRLAD